MWTHIIYISFICKVISATNEVNAVESDVSLPDPKPRVESDVSYIDDRFERPGQIEPQILNLRLNTDANEAENIDFQWENPEVNQRQRLDFHLDLPDSNKPHILEFNMVNPKEKETENSSATLNVRRFSNHSSFRRNMNMSPLTFIKGHKKIFDTVLSTMNYPFMAAIIINGRLWCAGALVDENWVLTAAHCLNFVLHVSPIRYLGEHVKVRVGSIMPHEGGDVLDVVGAIRHPKFEEEPAPHADIALLKLARHLELGKYVNIIKIYEGMKEPLPQSFIVVAGWGATRGSDLAFRDHTPNLNVGRMKVRSQSYCIDCYQLINDFEFTPELFCASIRNGSRDACLFDAGAPAIQQNMLMGVMSFGPEKCGANAQPAVFIKAFYFRDFVRNTISSYKTTRELIEAMREIALDLKRPPVRYDFHTPSHLID